MAVHDCHSSSVALHVLQLFMQTWAKYFPTIPVQSPPDCSIAFLQSSVFSWSSHTEQFYVIISVLKLLIWIHRETTQMAIISSFVTDFGNEVCTWLIVDRTSTTFTLANLHDVLVTSIHGDISITNVIIYPIGTICKMFRWWKLERPNL